MNEFSEFCELPTHNAIESNFGGKIQFSQNSVKLLKKTKTKRKKNSMAVYTQYHNLHIGMPEINIDNILV